MNATKTKSFKDLLNGLNACKDAIEWAEENPIEQIIKECYRGDWLLWLAKQIDIDSRKLHLAKGYCAKTVIHLMKDQRSRDAVQAAIDYGNGEINRNQLNAAAYAAAAAYTYAAADADAAYAYAAYAAAAYAAAAAAAAADDAYADDAYAAAYAAAAADAAYAADAAADAADAAAADAADAAYAAAYAAAAADADAYAARKKALLETADICREHIGDLIIEKVNKLLNQ